MNFVKKPLLMLRVLAMATVLGLMGTGLYISLNAADNRQAAEVTLEQLSRGKAQGEYGGGYGISYTVICYSESRYELGSSYWDCGDCSRYEDSRGRGRRRSCNTSH